MFLTFLKKMFNFFVLFLMVVIWLYMEKLFEVPLQTITEIFSVGFPWNLIILTAVINFGIWIFVSIFKLFKKRDNTRYVKRSYV